MKKYIIYFISIILVLCIVVFIFFKSITNIVYDKVSVVESKDTALKFLSISIPKQIIIHTDFYRNTVITNKLELDKILDSINTIKSSSSDEKPILESTNSSYKILGKIIYNNKIDEFSLDNKLIFNNDTYNSNSYLINNLHKKLINYFNTYDHLIDILNTENSSVYYEKENKSNILSKEKKETLINKLSKLQLISDEEKLNCTKINDKKLYTLTIRINKNISDKANNLVFIDVYRDYVVIQFLADDNGKKIYMKGTINEV